MGQLANSDGSVEYRYGKVRLFCSANGPVEAKIRDEQPDKATLEVIFRPATGLTGFRQAVLQDRTSSCLHAMICRELMPRSLVTVVIQLLETDGMFASELTAGINGATLALVDAGVPLKGLVLAATYKSNESNYTIAFMYPSKRLVLCESHGQFTKSEVREAIESAESETEAEWERIRISRAEGA